MPTFEPPSFLDSVLVMLLGVGIMLPGLWTLNLQTVAWYHLIVHVAGGITLIIGFIFTGAGLLMGMDSK